MDIPVEVVYLLVFGLGMNFRSEVKDLLGAIVQMFVGKEDAK